MSRIMEVGAQKESQGECQGMKNKEHTQHTEENQGKIEIKQQRKTLGVGQTL